MVLIKNLSGPRHIETHQTFPTRVRVRVRNQVRIQVRVRIVDDREMVELKLAK